MHPWVIYANEISRDRERETRTSSPSTRSDGCCAQSGSLSEPRQWHVRRRVAQGLAFASRATATAVRRLDDCVADDLGRSLAPTE